MKYTPRSVSDLVEIARNAQSSNRVKASGSRWSSSAVARAEDAWVDTSALDRIIPCDMSRLADELWNGGSASKLVLVQAGIKIYALATALWRNGLSIPTLGGEIGQSIAGAIATGTHGSDIDLPPISAMVRAIHLVAPGGHEYWLEHPDRPVASLGSLQEHYEDWHESIRMRRHEEAFDAALVSVGRCGFVYAYVLEIESAFQLRSDRGRSSWPAVRNHLQSAADSGDWRAFIRNHSLPFDESTQVQSSFAPCAVSVNGRLSMIWLGTREPDQFTWIHRDEVHGGWTRKRIVDDGRTRISAHRPAIAFFQGRYYVAWTGTDPSHPYLHLVRSTDATGSYWDDHIRFDGESPNCPQAMSSEGPTLLAANGRLHIAWVGTRKPGRFRWMTSQDGVLWQDKRILTDPERERRSDFRPALAFHGDRYYLAWTGTNRDHPYIHMIRSTNASGTEWHDHIRFDGGSASRPQAMSSDAPVLLSANNRLHAAWVGTNKPGRLRWITSSDGITWDQKTVLSDPSQTRRSNRAPEIVYHDGRYYLFWSGYGSQRNVHMLRSMDSAGSGWGDHARLTVPPGPRVDMEGIRGLDVALNPDGANGQAWWTVRTKVLIDEPPTWVRSELTAAEQRKLVQALSQAMNPDSAFPAAGALGFLGGLLLGGFTGAIVLGLYSAIAAGATADSDDVFALITDLVFSMELGGPPKTGPNFEITSGSAAGYAGGYAQKYAEFWAVAPKAQFTELFFDAQESAYLRFIDELLALFRSRGSGKQAGYVAIRFMGPSEAPLAMQRWTITAAVEIALLEDFDPQAKKTIEACNQIAQRYDVRFHWGMTRPSGALSPGAQSEIERWKQGAARLNVRGGDGLSSAFSRAAGLEPDVLRRYGVLFWGAA